MIAPALPLEVTSPPKVRDYVSWSAITTYLQCPLRYRFRYVDQLPEEFLSSTLVFGQAIHAALETYFRFQLTTGHSLGLDPLLAAYHEHWASVDPDTVRYGASDSLASFGQLAEKIFATFLTHVTDFKTSRSRWSPADVDAAAGQLLLYGELLRRRFDRPVQLQFAVLTKTKQARLTNPSGWRRFGAGGTAAGNAAPGLALDSGRPLLSASLGDELPDLSIPGGLRRVDRLKFTSYHERRPTCPNWPRARPWTSGAQPLGPIN